ncbi:AAA family ATPase [Rhizobium hidalgonense]|uniref:AAA family ATPase n=1 Tax=Rhizobium hidalgonense TaxID=1538159 RepID=UPI0013E28827|nr:MoxR family ATPase [Rhizobium hidalgonense]
MMEGLELDARLLDNRLEGTSFAARAAGGKKRPYTADKSLETAASLAVLLGQPLLLSGLPGVGKTGAAYYLASKVLGEEHEPIRLTVTTQTSGRDLLYKFDALGRFHFRKYPLRRFLRFEALGQAIVTACGANALVLDSAKDEPITDPQRIAEIVGDEFRADGPLRLRDLFPRAGELSDIPAATVVLIDEIDKAPRDTPNDLLESFEAMRFNIDELGLKIGVVDETVDASSRKRARPIIVATTNAENNLPDAFLRRCVFHEIAMPNKERLEAIVFDHLMTMDRMDRALAERTSTIAVSLGLRVAEKVRGSSRVPGTAEYIALARAIHASPLALDALQKALEDGVSVNQDVAKAILGVMVKTADDLINALRALPVDAVK